MSKIWYVVGGVGGYLLGFLGGLDDLLRLVILCIILDYITGIIKAVRFKEVSSKVSYVGVLKKLSLLIFIGFAHALDMYMFDMNLRALAIGVVIGHEGLSILENLSKLGVPIPKKVREVLKQLNEDAEEVEKEEKVIDIRDKTDDNSKGA